MSDASKVFFLGLISLCEFLELAGSNQGLWALWGGLAGVWSMQLSGESGSVITFAVVVLVFAYAFFSE